MEVKHDVVSLLRLALERGITVFQEDGKLKFKVAKDKKVDPEIVHLLKSNKEEILTFLSEGMGDLSEIKKKEETILPFDRHQVHRVPLSYSQEQLWFIDQYGGSVQYHQPLALRLKNDLDKDLLEKALTALIDRHEVLRTAISEEEGKPYQVFLQAEDWAMGYSEGEEFRNPSYLVEFIEMEFHRPFDLSQDFMLRAHLIKCAANDHVLILVMHHISSDGWSKSILVKDLIELYSAAVEKRPSRLQPLAIQYADYAYWQRQRVSGEYLESQLDWWAQQLEGAEVMKLPADFSRPPIQSTRGASEAFRVEIEVAEQLRALSLAHGATLFMTLLASFKVLLHRYSGQEDLSVGTPLANRNRAEIESLVGFFINSLVLRSDLSKQPTFVKLLERVKQTTLAAYDHQEIPLEQIVRKVEPERSPNRSPLFQVMFTVQNIPEIPTLELGELSLSSVQTEHRTSKFDLICSITEGSKGLNVELVYCIDLFKRETIQQLAQHFQELLKAIATNPEEKINRLRLTSEAEEQKLIVDFNNTRLPYPGDKGLLAHFEAQGEKNPEHTALVFQGQSLTYRELDSRSNQLAHFLKANGVQRGDRVGVLSKRGFDMIAGIFGVLKCGGIYVPLNLEYPPNRLSYILQDAKASKVLFSDTQVLKNTDLEGFDFLDITLASTFSEERLPQESLLDAGAYVMYTSGTTGQPKGILVSQRNILKLAFESNEIAIKAGDRVLQWSNFSFDGSTYDIYNTLLNGASLYLISEEEASDVECLAKHIRQHQLTVCFMTTAMFNAFVDHELGALKSLRKLLFGGELVSVPHVKKALESLGPDKLIHMYGPTETTVYATCYPINSVEGQRVPIGGPLSNTSIYLLNEAGDLAGIGILGEIYIGGDGVALGYLGRSELTGEKFISDSFSKDADARLYKTGDLAIMGSDGQIDFVGRKDAQIKMRGYRIELGEIETVLHECPGVNQCIVLAQKDTLGTKQLIAYIVPQGTFDKAAIIAYAKQQLPDYMVPSVFVPLDQLPLNTNGKVDKKALPEWNEVLLTEKSYVAPQSDMEKAVAEIWQDLLQLDAIGLDDPFFQIGGHSLLAMRVVSAIRKQLELELSVREMFTYTTIRTMAAHLEAENKAVLLPPIEREKRTGRIPLSYSQERLWFIDQYGGSSQYHIPTVLSLKNEVDQMVLEKALQGLVERHEVLRTVIKSAEGEAYQELLPAAHWKMRYSEGPEFENEETLREIINQELFQAFDLSRDYLLRAHLIRNSATEYKLVIVMHHIASDGWSEAILVKDLIELYRAGLEDRKPDLPALPIQYADYAIWQRKHLSGKFLEDQLDWWESQLQGVEALELPTDFPRPTIQSTRGSSYIFALEAELKDRLKSLSAKADTTLFMTMLSAFKVLLHRYAGQDDICVGTSLANRSQKETEDLVGFFINALVLRSNLGGNPSFLKLLQEVKSTTLAAFGHQEAPFSKIVDRLEPERNASRNPIFQVLFVMQNMPEAPALDLEGMQLHSENPGYHSSALDLAFTVTEYPDRLKVGVKYCSDLFSEKTIAQFARHFEALLQAIVANPQQSIDLLRMLSHQEIEQLLIDFNNTTAKYNGATAQLLQNHTLVDLFERQAKQSPDHIALIFGEKQWTYRELDEASSQLAQHLRQQYSVQPEGLVGLLTKRSDWAILAILGILKAGAAYVPMSVKAPEERKKWMIDDTGLSTLISLAEHREDYHNLGLEVLELDTQWENISQNTPLRAEEISIHPEQLAYVIYTSGSTGQPKGVMVEHRGVCNTILSQIADFDIRQGDRCLQFFALSFDASGLEIYTALLSGAGLYILEEENKTIPRELYQFVQNHALDVITLPAAYLGELDLEQLRKVRTLISGGEAPPVEQVAAFLKYGNYCNSYGPTETSICATVYRLDKGQAFPQDSIPIGRPVSNVQTYILDAHEQLVPLGVIGELCIGGQGLARAYLNAPVLTSEKFIPNSFDATAKSRLYKTGDLARWLPDGNIEFRGRKDNQVKIRGYRIELGEIEKAVNACEEVKSAAVLALSIGEDLRIVAYVTTAGEFNKAELLEQVKVKIPAYMIPSVWMPLEEMPMTSNGKIDRKALPEPDGNEQPQEEYQAPQSEMEKLLVDIWQDILKVENISVQDNFFELGGHSLLAIRVMSTVQDTLNIQTNLEDIFTYPTIAGLAACLQSEVSETVLPPIVAGERPEKTPLSYSQERLWFVDQLGGSSQFHQPNILRLKRALDKAALEAALRDLVARHEVLRTVIREEEGQAYQQILSAEDWTMTYSKGKHFKDEHYLRQFLSSEIIRPFDLSEDYMLRAHLIRLEEEDHILLLLLHHISTDGWSNSILVDDLMELYSARLENRTPQLDALPIQYADYAAWQRKHLAGKYLEEQLDWWGEQLKGLQELKLPLDRPRPERPNSKGTSWVSFVNKDLTDRLNQLALQADATLFMLLLSVFKVLLSRYSGQADICVGTSLANRNRKEVEPLVGFFINSLVLRTDLAGDPDFRTLLERIKTTVLEAFAHQEVPFEKIVERVETERDLSRNPVFQILFTLHNTPAISNLKLGELELKSEASEFKRALYDLSFYLTEGPEGMRISIVYKTDLFDAATIERMGMHFQTLLESVVAEPDLPVGQLSIISSSEQQQLVSEYQGAAKGPKERTVVDWFEEQALGNPDQIALVFEGKSLTYRELNEGANRIAHHLRNRYQLQADDLVGLMLESSPWAILGILGILKTGAAYVPIDVHHPLERRRFMIDDTDLKVLLCTSEEARAWPKMAKQIVVVDQEFDQLDPQNDGSNLNLAISADALVYVIYTSGSTGQSKGVMITHRNLMNYVQGLLSKVDLRSNRSFGLMSTLSADLGNTVLYGALLTGTTLHVFTKKALTDANYLHGYFRENAVDAIKIVPSHWRALDLEELPLLPQKSILFGGEALTVDLIEKIKTANAGLEVINHYGPTEATIGKLLHRVNLASSYTSIPIGRPFGGAEAYVVDPNGNLCPIGLPGELWLGGEGIARGYLKRPALTEEKFIANPFNSQSTAKLYRTGDQVRQLSDGNFEFLGRIDDQVKIRGYRVEPREIESVLREVESVKDTVVIAKANSDGLLHLVAYVVPQDNWEATTWEQHLESSLPEYMVPRLWVELDHIPLTSNGKVDRKALPEPERSSEARLDFVAPRTETEKKLAEIWQKLLKIDQVGIHDHFFKIGGHSLLAIRVISAIRKTLQQKPDLEDIFTHPTIEKLAQFLEGNSEENLLPPLTPIAPRPDKIPLSYAQERLWFTDQFGGSVQYHMPAVLRIENTLDKAVLETALSDLIDRHEVLRTCFKVEDGKPYQKIRPADEWAMAYSQGSRFKEENALREFIASEVNRPFDLSSDFMLRAHLVQFSTDDHLLVLVMHHIASDGWSNSILVKDLMEFYAARLNNRAPRLLQLPIQYADYAVWQRKHLSDEFLSKQLDWWEKQLEGIEPTCLPSDFPRPAIQSHKGSSVSIHIEKELTDRLNQLSLDSDATLFMTLVAAYKVLISRYSGQKDICIGAPLAERNYKEVEPLVGCFLNALLLRSKLEGNPSFQDYLEQIKTNTLAAFRHQQVPFERIVERVESDRSLSHSPIFQVLFSLRNTPEVPDLELGGLQISSEPSGQNISQLDLAMYVTENAKGMRIALLYCSDLFSRETVENMAHQYRQLLQSIVDQPSLGIDQLELLTSKDRQQLLVDFNPGTTAYPEDKSIVDYFKAQVAQTPERPAVVCAGRTLSYEMLDKQSDRLAAYLKKTYSLQADDLIGIMMDRSEWSIVAMWGIWKTGAGFVPIDQSLPKERVALIIEDTQIKSLIVHSENLYNVIVGGYLVNTFAIDVQMQSLEENLAMESPPQIRPTDLAYVIYTSGSTGTPKGVMVQHGGIKNTIVSQKEAFGIEQTDRCLQFYSTSFDASVLEIFNPLLSSASLYIIDEETKINPDSFLNFMQSNAITVAAIPPTYLNEMDIKELSGMKILITGGEAAAVEKINAFLKYGDHCNSYGPTETSICATVHRTAKGESIAGNSIPLGIPIANVRLYVLDEQAQLVPRGVVGELCIAGEGVARGYLHNEALTEEKFMANPFDPEGAPLMYRSGDLVRWLPDGNLVFMGRKDDQVKIRGYRIELGEIENSLKATPGVLNATVLARKIGGDGLRLIAYVVPEGTFNRADLKASLNARLPEYMVPAFWMEMESLPMTSTGKVDKKKLPDPDVSQQSDQEYVAPRNELEEELADMWKELLAVEQVGIYDNFFVLGGHSLLAVRLLSAIKEKFALSIPLKVIFEFPTIAELQKYIQLMKEEDDGNFEDSEAFEL